MGDRHTGAAAAGIASGVDFLNVWCSRVDLASPFIPGNVHGRLEV